MYTRLLGNHLPESSFFLFGPRQVGKSTLLKKLEARLYIDLLDPGEHLTLSRNPGLLSEMLDGGSVSGGTVVIDEIQRVPALLDVVQQRIDRGDPTRFAMSGSSARKLRRGGANLLGGRAIVRTLHPLSSTELGGDFDLPKVLQYGSLPAMWTLLMQGRQDLVLEHLRSYVHTYIREEVMAEALVRNLQGFQNFIEVAASQFAQQVNFAGVARDCHVGYATVRQYYSVLEDTLLGTFLPPYTRSIRKRMSRQPRFYFFDNGVTRALLGTLRADPSPLEKGRLFEQWFIQEVVRIDEYRRKDFRLSFYRTSHGAEVDLLICRGTRILAAIECKHRDTISRTDLSGLRSLRETIGDVPGFVVAPVRHPSRIDFAEVLPPLEMLDRIEQL